MTTVKPRMREGELVLDSCEIGVFIRKAVNALARTPFDPATGALPLRPDVYCWVFDYLAGADAPVIQAGGFDPPTLALKPDGTVTIRFVFRLRSLTFLVLCQDVVRHTRTFDDGLTVVEGFLPGTFDADAAAAEDLLDWLSEAPPEDPS